MKLIAKHTLTWCVVKELSFLIMNSQAIQLYALFCAIFFVTEILCEAKVLTFLDLTEQNLLEVVSKCIPCLLLFIWFRKNGKRLEKLGDDETVQRNKCITMGFLFSGMLQVPITKGFVVDQSSF